MLKKAFWFALLSLGIIIIIYAMAKDFSKGKNPEWGVTFSSLYAQELGLNPEKVLAAVLDDLEVKRLRLPIYWTQVEKMKGQFDFAEVDKQVIAAGKRDTKVVLVIGERVPRWPECHVPVWAKSLDKQEFDKRTNLLVKETVEHFKVYSNIVAWQVNNEPFLKSFGHCRPISSNKLKQQIDIVRSIDNQKRPIILTESGELSTWIRSARQADIIGTSLYRTVWNKYFGYWRYPFPPAFYRWHADIIMKFFSVNKVVVSELQAEPWPPGKHISQTNAEEQLESFSLDDFVKIIKYVKKTGFDEVYLWGVEWWYWFSQQGHPEFWQFAKSVIRNK